MNILEQLHEVFGQQVGRLLEARWQDKDTWGERVSSPPKLGERGMVKYSFGPCHNRGVQVLPIGECQNETAKIGEYYLPENGPFDPVS